MTQLNICIKNTIIWKINLLVYLFSIWYMMKFCYNIQGRIYYGFTGFRWTQWFLEKICPVFFFKIKNILDIRYILYACKVKHERSLYSCGFVSLQRCTHSVFFLLIGILVNVTFKSTQLILIDEIFLRIIYIFKFNNTHFSFNYTVTRFICQTEWWIRSWELSMFFMGYSNIYLMMYCWVIGSFQGKRYVY